MVDFFAGKSLRTSGRGGKIKARLASMRRTAKRLKKSRGRWAANAPAFVSAEPLGGGLRGSEIAGVSDSGLLLLRRAASVPVRPSAQSRSLTACCTLAFDLAWRAAAAPVVRWGKEVGPVQT
eukprot:8448653-Pyramimonas_sp.AAC.1